ncbi:transglutaminase TgpA family protein [Angustibacter sp. McL0619]|uniref:transglutaminase TgpA family protein n=1 Tax=Angustibacter sp. McL0619 TaxID=3415676 RepID=UPI003CFB1697
MSSQRGATADSVRDLPLRGCVLALELAAAASVGVAQLVPWTAVGGTALALVVVALAAAHGGHRMLRTTLGFASLLVAAGVCLASSGMGSTSLAFATLWLMVTAQLAADTLRELCVTALLALALMLLPGGLAPAPALTAPWLVGWVAAVSTLALAVRRSAHPDGAHARARASQTQGAGRRVAGPIAVAVGVSLLAALVAALLMPTPQGSAAQRMQALSRLAGKQPPQTQQRSASSYLGGELDMRNRGELPSTPVAHVPAASALYWRSGTLSRYDGVTWRATRGSISATAVPAQSGQYLIAAALADAADPSLRGRPVHEDRVTMLAPASGFLLVPGQAESVRTDQGSQVVVANGSLVYAAGTAGTSFGYSVAWTPAASATDEPGPAVSSAAAAQSPPGDWLQLPPSVTARTRALATQVTGGATTRGEQVAMVEHYLSSTYPYRLDSPVPPPGQDAVDHFLFDARTGFCEQFAAAEVVLLRSLGVPSRMATGYAFGSVQGDVRVLRGKDAHAWVEVWQPGSGWLTSDPTPGGTPSTGAAASNPLMDAVHKVMSSTRTRWLVAGGLLLLGGAVAGIVLLVGRRRRARALAVPVARGSMDPLAWTVCIALDELCRALQEAGRPSPPAETLAELARRVPEVPPRAFVTAERVMYGRRVPAQDLVDEAVRDLGNGTRLIRSQLQATTRN